ncbi:MULTISPECIES: YbhB/YbcL family Raf kinase inhibitor-like protein [Halobacterium]|uniref:UPF0098 family protein n=3 Tax=Halobacterium salinarum TaxID=2242 RepID=Q9HND1_HALSA|nr:MULTISPECIES: YbhB/YbcL family Raf kinase inhibitor-like protein [Halobacterium]AAG20289.1 conserved hypothetical protein [Halobacterium salinarum NRC-1]MBB6089307.1 hypothetical protein [Halobacterium salinarum]MDL0119207.1 YbhB/YbcL family Raf kinase inhibitor-like protein [Halobacterium salinarum]MDL0127207.1 YbhB/YbcL family Raf kinase inhibitor-like protein [Halobacterium salinarum]MDL0130106.1 YbhB/YbcL family Raf kinase inhibitor-like protein [Halobacterium salinarum]
MRGQPVHRRSVLALVGGGAVSALAGCTDTTDGDATTTTPEPTPRSETQPTPTATDDIPIAGPSPDFGGLGLASNAFADGAAIPDRYTRSGADVNPPLSIAGVPEDAATLVLVVDDPDAVDPAGEVWLHWLVWNIPASRTRIPAAWTPTEPTVGTNDFGERDYGGPAPPDDTHLYRFKLYALDTTLILPQDATERTVGNAVRGHVLASTQLVGSHAP